MDQMTYWFLCLPRPDIEHCIKIGTFGLSRKHLLGKVKVGDRVVCCAGKGDWKIIGVGTTTAEHYLDDTRVFLGEGIFPDRISIKVAQLSPDHEFDLMSIIDKLSFVTKLEYWSLYFRNAIVQMTESDWELITAKTGSSCTA